MDGKVVQPGLRGRGVVTLDRLGDLPVQPAALSIQQPGIDRLPGQSVAKHEAVPGLFDDESRRDKLLHEMEQRRLIVSGECAEKVKIEAAPGNGGKSEHVASWTTEGLETLLDGIVDTARDLWTTQFLA